MKDCWKLLDPIKLGSSYLKNRIVMPPMESRLSRPDGSVTKAMIAYYEERAKGGVGAIIVENTFIDNKESRSSISSSGIYNDHMIASKSELAEAIKAHGTVALIQLSHGGRQCHREATGLQPVAPSAIPCKVIGVVPRELASAEIEEIQNAFAEAARRAKQAGFDGVELHGAHGYLLGSFLSPYTNKRTDQYGGPLENRALFALQIIRGIRKKVGNDFIIGYRISADEYIPQGLTLKETKPFAKMLEESKIDYIHVSAGIYESGHHTVPPVYFPKAYLVHLAWGIKKSVKIPVITVGAHDIYTAEEALQEGKADLVALGRGLIADPELPNKLATGGINAIRPCIRGNEGCLSRFDTAVPQRCEVNPACGRENEFKITQAANKKDVMVIGGGIAGLETARIAALRGHSVTIVEKEEKLGGHLIEASVPRFKESTRQLLNWIITQVKISGVKIKLGIEADASFVKQAKPEVLIAAVGSDYHVPQIPGCNRGYVATAGKVLLNGKITGEKVVVVGAGLIGCETALYIAEELEGKVTIVEMLDDMLVGIQRTCHEALRERMQKMGIVVNLGWCLDKVSIAGVECLVKNGGTVKIKADTVVLATGLVPRKNTKERFINLAPETYAVGDCIQARKIFHCFEDAWRVALYI
ncbi:FAD-dependent oxidoreductase [Chloroflexota bacterium]